MQMVARLALVPVCLTVVCCAAAPGDQRVQATYDKNTNKLSQLTINSQKDGQPNIFCYMDGTKFLRIEIDSNEDGKIDRWEYYGADQKLEKVGLSRSNDGKVDSWVYQAPDGSVARVEVSKHRDGKVDRTEFYERGVLVRTEEDSNRDGRADKWETYENGALATVSFDTKFSGTPDRTIDYRQEALKAPPK